MRKGYDALLKNLGHINPPERLYRNILVRIESAQVRKAKVRFVFTGTTAVCSLVALIPALQYTIREFSQSGFLQYSSLLFSDSAAIATYWKEFTLSLAESFPIFGITAILSILFVFLGSLKIIASNIKTIFIPAQLFNHSH